MEVFLVQTGCRLNYSENHLLAQQLRQAGHTVVGDPRQAQIIVVNTCAVTAAAAQKSRQLIRSQHKANPAARIVATGCYTSLEPKTVAQLPGVWKVAGNADKDLLASLLEEWSSAFPDLQSLERVHPTASPISPDPHARTRAFVKVQDGCHLKCTFCIVTLARGDSRSKDPDQIVREIQALTRDGYQEAVLTGVHLGSYGRHSAAGPPGGLPQLVRRILAETEIPRLRLSSLEPWNVDAELFQCWAEWPDRLCPHLHLPLQAGTDPLLARMGRRCSTASFAQLVESARRRIPDLTITTDIIVGFPGETDSEFAQGLHFIAHMQFADAHVFPFSARAGTRAATLPHQVSKAVKKARLRQVQTVVAATGREIRTGFLNSVRPVLWEGKGQVLAAAEGCLWNGYTDNYLKVETVTASPVSLTNRISQVRLKALAGQVLDGEVQPDFQPDLPSRPVRLGSHGQV